MDKLEIQELINKLNTDVESYKFESDIEILERCPYIVEVGYLTVTTSSNGVVTTANTNRPAQFSRKAVDEILSMNWYNGNNEKVVPVVYARKEWYRKRLIEAEKSKEHLNQVLNHFNVC